MFARDHSAIGQDRQAALVAAVDHGVDQFLPNQVHLVVPSQLLVLMEWLWRTCPTQWREGRWLDRVGQQIPFFILVLELFCVGLGAILGGRQMLFFLFFDGGGGLLARSGSLAASRALATAPAALGFARLLGRRG